MKNSTIIFVIAVAVLMLICGCVFAPSHEVYSNCGVVSNVDYENDLVSVEDFGGFIWQFFGCEDWEEGDICAMTMDNNGTPDTIFDDIVVNTNYCGWVY